MNNDMIDFNTNAMRLIPLFSRSDELQSNNVQDVHANATRMLLVLISSNVSTMPKLACSVCQGRHSIRSNTDVAGSKQKRRFLLRKKLVVQILTRRSKSAQR